MAKSQESYQELKQKLDHILSELQHEDTDIDQAATLYKEGQAVLKQLENYLDKISSELDIEVLPNKK